MEGLRRKWAWATENPLFWFNLALIGISILIFIWPWPRLATGPSDLRVRLWGLALQLIGVITVWLDLTRTARKFGKPGLMRNTWAWLKACFSPALIVGSVATAQGGATVRARGRARVTIQQEAPLPDRVTTLETYVGQIDQDLDAAYKRIDQRADELGAKIKTESETCAAAIGGINKKVEETVTGNLATLVFGVVWLAVGVVLATLAPELVKIRVGEWFDVGKALW